MTREESIRTKTWMADDGRILHVSEITDNHLRSLLRYLRRELSPGRAESGMHTDEDEMPIVSSEIVRRAW